MYLFSGYSNEEMDQEILSILNDRSRIKAAVRDMLKEKAFDKAHNICEIGIPEMCPANEICVSKRRNSRTGMYLII